MHIDRSVKRLMCLSIFIAAEITLLPLYIVISRHGNFVTMAIRGKHRQWSTPRFMFRILFYIFATQKFLYNSSIVIADGNHGSIARVSLFYICYEEFLRRLFPPTPPTLSRFQILIIMYSRSTSPRRSRVCFVFLASF